MGGRGSGPRPKVYQFDTDPEQVRQQQRLEAENRQLRHRVDVLERSAKAARTLLEGCTTEGNRNSKPEKVVTKWR
jgi:hypothetical protein